MQPCAGSTEKWERTSPAMQQDNSVTIRVTTRVTGGRTELFAPRGGGSHSVKTGRVEQDHKRWKKRQEISNLEFGYPESKQQARNAEPRSVLAVRTLACAHVGEAPGTVPRASIAVREIQSHQSHSRREVLIGPFHWLSSYGGRGCCCSHDRGHHLRHRKAPLEVLRKSRSWHLEYVIRRWAGERVGRIGRHDMTCARCLSRTTCDTHDNHL